MDIALEAGAEDIEAEDDGAISVIAPWEILSDVVDQLKAGSLTPDHAEVTMLADTYMPCDAELADQVLRLIDALEDLDDVQNVFSNGEFPQSALEG